MQFGEICQCINHTSLKWLDKLIKFSLSLKAMRPFLVSSYIVLANSGTSVIILWFIPSSSMVCRTEEKQTNPAILKTVDLLLTWILKISAMLHLAAFHVKVNLGAGCYGSMYEIFFYYLFILKACKITYVGFRYTWCYACEYCLAVSLVKCLFQHSVTYKWTVLLLLRMDQSINFGPRSYSSIKM